MRDEATPQRPTLTVAMPAFNERGSIEGVVEGVAAALEATGLPFEILIVDDGSTDGTGEIADRLAATKAYVSTVHHQRNRGIGAGWRSCVLASKGEWVFLTCADGQAGAAEALRFFEARGDAGVVVGIRRGAPRSPRRRALTAAFQLLVRSLLPAGVADFGFCFLFRGDLVRSFRTAARDLGIAILAEWLYLARRSGVGIVELPIEVLPRAAGSSKTGRPRDALATLLDVLRLAVRYRVVGR